MPVYLYSTATPSLCIINTACKEAYTQVYRSNISMCLVSQIYRYSGA